MNQEIDLGKAPSVKQCWWHHDSNLFSDRDKWWKLPSDLHESWLFTNKFIINLHETRLKQTCGHADYNDTKNFWKKFKIEEEFTWQLCIFSLPFALSYSFVSFLPLPFSVPLSPSLYLPTPSNPHGRVWKGETCLTN